MVNLEEEYTKFLSSQGKQLLDLLNDICLKSQKNITFIYSPDLEKENWKSESFQFRISAKSESVLESRKSDAVSYMLHEGLRTFISALKFNILGMGSLPYSYRVDVDVKEASITRLPSMGDGSDFLLEIRFFPVMVITS